MNNVQTHIYEIIEQAVVNAFWTRGTNALFDRKIQKIGNSQDFKQDLFIIRWNGYISSCWSQGFFKQQPEIPVTSEVKIKEDNIPAVPVKKAHRRRRKLPLLLCHLGSLKTTKKTERRTKQFLTTILSPRPAPSAARAEIPSTVKLNSTTKDRKSLIS